jgi:hypothetical protein
MVLRKLRWLTAGLLAAATLLAAPSRSDAGTQILIEEIDSGGAVFGTTQIVSGTSATFSTANFLNISVTATANTGAISSLTTTVSAAPAASFDTSHQLRVIVTDDGFVNPFPGQPALVENNAAASSGIGGGQNILTNQTQLLNVPLSPGTGQTASPASGTPLGDETQPAIDIRPLGLVSPTTTSNVSNMPAQFAIQQTILVRAATAGTIASGSTLGGSASSIVSTNAPAAVPAPAGLVLALAAVPVLGLRRAFRRKSAN